MKKLLVCLGMVLSSQSFAKTVYLDCASVEYYQGYKIYQTVKLDLNKNTLHGHNIKHVTETHYFSDMSQDLYVSLNRLNLKFEVASKTNHSDKYWQVTQYNCYKVEKQV